MKKIYRLYVYNIKIYIYCVSSVTLINRFHLMVNCGILSRELHRKEAISLNTLNDSYTDVSNTNENLLHL